MTDDRGTVLLSSVLLEHIVPAFKSECRMEIKFHCTHCNSRPDCLFDPADSLISESRAQLHGSTSIGHEFLCRLFRLVIICAADYRHVILIYILQLY